MGARRAAGILVTLVSLLYLAYAFYTGAVNGMIGCVKVYSGSKLLGTACDASTLAKLKAEAGKGARLTPVDTPVAVGVVLAWMGLLVGPWLAFGEKPSSVRIARVAGR